MARGILRKAIVGAAAAGVPMLMEEQRAQIQAKRDAKLQQFQSSERAAGQAFTAGENAANRQFQAGENQASRAFQTGERVAGQEFQAGENAATREQSNMQFQTENARAMAQFGLAAQQAQQALETGELGLVQARRVESLYETLASDTATNEQKTAAADKLQSILPQRTAGDFGFEKLSGGAMEADQLVRTNRRAGTAEIMPLGAASQGATRIARPQTDADYEALPSGAMFVDPEDGQTYQKP